MIKFVTQYGRDIVLKKEYVQALRAKNNNIRISEQFPSEMRERRTYQIDGLLELREQYKDSDMKISLIKDKISMKSSAQDVFGLSPL